jgi:hypothetical protein
VTEQEIMEIFKKYPIDFIRVREFLTKEPGIREAFLVYASQYINTFTEMIGIEFKPNVYAKLQEIMLMCLVVGYLTRQNFFQVKLAESLEEEKPDGSASTD